MSRRGREDGMSPRRQGLIAAIACAALLLTLGALAQTPGGRHLVDGIAAVVGDEIILESEVDEEFYIYQMRSGVRVAEDEVAAIRNEIVREMVDEMLLIAKAKRDTIELGPGELEREIARRVGDLKDRHGSEEAFNAALGAEGITQQELEQLYRDDIEKRLLAESVVRKEIHSKIDITWGEVEEYYEEHPKEVGRVPEAYQIAAILVVPKVDESARERAIDRVSEARNRLERGESFEDVARLYSEDASAQLGGDLGTFGRGAMVSEFEEAVFALEVGEISGVVSTRFGFHIVEVLERDGDTVHARHILARVAPGPDDEERAKALAESVRQLALGGEEFGALAREYSDDLVSRENDGVLGWLAPVEMSRAIRDAVAPLEPSEVSEVVPGEHGYYLIKLLAHEAERIASLDEVREDLRDYLFGLKAEEAYVVLIDRLSREIYIEIRTGMVSEQ